MSKLCAEAPACFTYEVEDRAGSAARLAAAPGVAAAAAELGYASLPALEADAAEHFEVLYSLTTFCLTPPGDTATRRGFFDALLFGCIPVVFAEASRQWPWFLPPRVLPNVTALVPRDDALAMRSGAELEALLAREYDSARTAAMRAVMSQHATSLQYSVGDHGSSDAAAVGPDAADVLLWGLVNASRRRSTTPARQPSDWLF